MIPIRDTIPTRTYPIVNNALLCRTVSWAGAGTFYTHVRTCACLLHCPLHCISFYDRSAGYLTVENSDVHEYQRRWYVIRAKEYVKTNRDTPLRDQNPDYVRRYLEEKGKKRDLSSFKAT